MLRESFNLIVLSVMLVVGTTGCVPLLVAGAAGVAAGGTAIWLNDKIVQEVEATYEEAVVAAKEALDALNLPLNKETRTASATQLLSNEVDRSTIWIDIHAVSDTTSRIEVRVGAVGNEEASRQIMDEINKHL